MNNLWMQWMHYACNALRILRLPLDASEEKITELVEEFGEVEVWSKGGQRAIKDNKSNEKNENNSVNNSKTLSKTTTHETYFCKAIDSPPSLEQSSFGQTLARSPDLSVRAHVAIQRLYHGLLHHNGQSWRSSLCNQRSQQFSGVRVAIQQFVGRWIFRLQDITSG